MERRNFLKLCSVTGVGLGTVGLNPLLSCGSEKKLFFKISLAEWSLHKMLFDKEITNLDFPKMAKEEFGINAVEYVSIFFKEKVKDKNYLEKLKTQTNDLGVVNLLIMVDGEGFLGDLDDEKRKMAVTNHHKWIDAAKFLGCHSIRVNAHGEGSYDEVKNAAIDGLGSLTKYGESQKINVIVENHGGYSSDGKWLSEVIKQVNNSYCGTLPDFGNFYEYDRYLGVEEMMPFAKGVSAKSYNFDEEGNETKIDYKKMLNIVKSAGYNGYIGVEYEGKILSEIEGVHATKNLLEKIGGTL